FGWAVPLDSFFLDSFRAVDDADLQGRAADRQNITVVGGDRHGILARYCVACRRCAREAVDIGAIRTAQIIDTHIRRVERQLAMTAGNVKVLRVAAKANVASGAAAKGHAAGAAKAVPIPFVRVRSKP